MKARDRLGGRGRMEVWVEGEDGGLSGGQGGSADKVAGEASCGGLHNGPRWGHLLLER